MRQRREKRGQPLSVYDMKKAAPTRRTRLRKMSPQKAKLMEQYKAAKDACGFKVRSAFSGILMCRTFAEPHHPLGRTGRHLLCFVWLTKAEHAHIHDHGQQSRALHWLMAPSTKESHT